MAKKEQVAESQTAEVVESQTAEVAEDQTQKDTNAFSLVGATILFYTEQKLAEQLNDDSIVDDNGEIIKMGIILRSAITTYKDKLEIVKVTKKNIKQVQNQLKSYKHSIKG